MANVCSIAFSVCAKCGKVSFSIGNSKESAAYNSSVPFTLFPRAGFVICFSKETGLYLSLKGKRIEILQPDQNCHEGVITVDSSLNPVIEVHQLDKRIHTCEKHPSKRSSRKKPQLSPSSRNQLMAVISETDEGDEPSKSVALSPDSHSSPTSESSRAGILEVEDRHNPVRQAPPLTLAQRIKKLVCCCFGSK